MIAHLVIWTWHPTVTGDQVEGLVHTLRELTADMPSLHRYECGPALGLRQGGDFGVIAVVHDAAGLDAYLDDPRHRDVATKVIGPMAASRIAVQIEVPPTFVGQ
ncbi:Dabb family protein [Dactylosporangium sp. NPDC005572]|uniref:Dabb family protein n=1 Tax=Dactylosporangium sp. NPDC005572 TaxID=3156889 RepID=UPI0033B316AF